ncbi:MAG: hypothetical protein Q4F95_09330 [Oscillospiraceae bacterium]|nr:hypothetical protein [Oscillospiraceae bacterium]
MKKSKSHIIRILIVSLSVSFLALLCIVLKLFTGIFGPPEYVYLDSYNENTKEGFVKVNEVNGIGIYDYKNDVIRAKFALKYCSNINVIHTYGEHYKDLNFLITQNMVKDLDLKGYCDNWSGIKYCNNIDIFSAVRSNFSDMSLLSGFKNLKYIDVQTTEVLKYSDIQTLKALKELYIGAPNIDIGEIIKAPVLNKLSISHAKEIVNIQKIKKSDSLTDLLLSDSIIDKQFLSTISELSDKIYIGLSYCPFSGDEAEAEKILNDLKEKGMKVEMEDGLISISSNDK